MENKFIKPLSILVLLGMTGLAGCSGVSTNTTQSANESDVAIPLEKVPKEHPPECTIQEYSAEELFTNSKDGIAVVLTDSGVGSAFVVKHEGNSTLLATNAHVVDGTNLVTLKWANGSQDQAAVVKIGDAQSRDNDLALLQVNGNKGTALKIKQSKINTGADIVALGAPHGLDFTITRGIVSAHREGGRVIQIDAPINPGNSGGAILDKTGCVVGVSTYVRKDSEGLGFGIASNQLQAFLVSETNPTQEPNEKAQDIVYHSPSSSPSYPQTCWTSAHPDAPKGKLISLPCKVSNPKSGLIVVNWSDGYNTRFHNHRASRDEIEDIESGTIKYGEIGDKLIESRGKYYLIVNADDGAESWIASDTLRDWQK